jgi:hypothetical protein
VLGLGIVLGAVPPCGTGVVVGALGEPLVVPPMPEKPMPDGVLPSVPGIEPVGLSMPGVGVDCVGLGGAGDLL